MTPEVEAALAWADDCDVGLETVPFFMVRFERNQAKILAAALRQAEAELARVGKKREEAVAGWERQMDRMDAYSRFAEKVRPVVCDSRSGEHCEDESCADRALPAAFRELNAALTKTAPSTGEAKPLPPVRQSCREYGCKENHDARAEASATKEDCLICGGVMAYFNNHYRRCENCGAPAPTEKP